MFLGLVLGDFDSIKERPGWLFNGVTLELRFLSTLHLKSICFVTSLGSISGVFGLSNSSKACYIALIFDSLSAYSLLATSDSLVGIVYIPGMKLTGGSLLLPSPLRSVYIMMKGD